VRERSNNNGTLNDGHGSQVPDAAQPESVHPTVDNNSHEAVRLDIESSVLWIRL